MHIVLFVSWYKTPKYPMYGTFFEEQARALQQKGNKVGVFFPDYYNFSSRAHIEQSNLKNDNGLPTYYFGYKARLPKMVLPNYYFFCKKAHEHFQKYIDAHGRPDVIHAHSCFFGGLVARYVSKKTGIPYVLTKHYTDLILRKGFFLVDVIMSKHIIKKSDATIAVSSGYAQNLADFLQIPLSDFSVIPNVVSDIFVNEPFITKPDKAQAFNFLTVSFIEPRKNHELMLEAFAVFTRTHPHATFTICGDGDTLPDLQMLAKKRNIAHQVFFVGLADRQQVLGYLKTAHCFLLASQYETFGVVLIEALAMGLPMISTDSTGPKDIVTSENGVITTDFSTEKFADAMEFIYNNYENYAPNDLRQMCIKKFGGDAITQQLIQIYDDVLAKNA